MRLPIAIAGLMTVAVAAPLVAQQGAPARVPKIILVPISDMDDPDMIRPTRPIEGFADWFSAADYPAEALAAGRQGVVSLTIRVRADGSIVFCEAHPNGDVDIRLGLGACSLISKRGKFRPPVDADGKAHGGEIHMSMRFALLAPGETGYPPTAPSAPGSSIVLPRLLDPNLLVLPADPKLFVNPTASAWLDIDAQGGVTRCRIRTTTGSDAGDAALCRRMMGARFDPVRTSTGAAAARQGFLVELRTAP